MEETRRTLSLNTLYGVVHARQTRLAPAPPAVNAFMASRRDQAGSRTRPSSVAGGAGEPAAVRCLPLAVGREGPRRPPRARRKGWRGETAAAVTSTVTAAARLLEMRQTRQMSP
ncbi:hypothetical protein [Streptomyces sp. WM6368]|uniref:hypothetical protein n=1 Tax=Streptomyces sp. WM6368 TaxID=1415554 RepID=UPI001F464DD4|nr:hypothetical protein [Streptomyces sp. WM6368]